VFETLPLTDELRELVREGAPTPAIRAAAVDGGMSTLREAAVGLCLDGVTSVAEVRLVPLD
jgi:type II secretory ATPase GspE/PulE/Tfp pilus assembly ATPase PilB-like protein